MERLRRGRRTRRLQEMGLSYAYHENGDYEQTDEALLKEVVALVRGQEGNEMSKRLLNCAASDFRKMTGKELKKGD